MKLRNKIVITMLLVGGISFGQSLIRYSFKGGLNNSNADFEVIENGVSTNREYENRNSFYIGAGIEFPISSSWSDFFLQIELIYSEQGWTYYFSSLEQTLINKLDQINLPILVKKQFFSNYFVGIGAYLGHVVNAEEKFRDEKRSFKINGYDNFDFGLLLGLGYKFKFGGLIEARYMYGLADVSEISYPSSFIEHEYKNRVIQIGIGYEF